MDNLSELFKYFLQYAVAPLLALIVWVYKVQHMRVGKLEERIASVEQSTAVIRVMIDNIKDDIKEIKQGIIKLVDRQ